MPSSWLANGKYAFGNASTQPSPNTNTSKDWEMRPTITPTMRSPGVASCDAAACAPPGTGGLLRVSLEDMALRVNAWTTANTSGCDPVHRSSFAVCGSSPEMQIEAAVAKVVESATTRQGSIISRFCNAPKYNNVRETPAQPAAASPPAARRLQPGVAGSFRRRRAPAE